jgi:cysteine desulfurase
VIYLDYNATTPVDPRVLDRMIPYFSGHFGNPSSASHSYGWTAAAAVDAAAELLASLVGAQPEDVVFTSGATEALNQAIKGLGLSEPGRHVVTVATEHKAVLDACLTLQRAGVEVSILPVDHSGLVDLDQLVDVLRPSTALVAVMWANNETGTIAAIEDIAAVVAERGIPFLSDATQAVGKIPVSAEHVDLLVCSGHKFYAPKGVGALIVRRGRGAVRVPRFIDGGGQQGGRRGGTLNVPGIVGMGAAAEVAGANLSVDCNRLEPLRDRLESSLLAAWPGSFVNGYVEGRLPQTSNIAFPGVDAAKLMAQLRSLAVSNASACQSEGGKPSHVLKAMGLADVEARASIRFSLGRPTTEQEITEAVDMVKSALMHSEAAVA